MDIIRWFWMQLICILEAFKKKPQKDTTKTESDPLRWIQPKHKWAWQDRSQEIQALDERVSSMKPHSRLRTVATFDGTEHQLHIWVGNTYCGYVLVSGNGVSCHKEHCDPQGAASLQYQMFLLSLEKMKQKHQNVLSKMTDAFNKRLLHRIKVWQVACSNGIVMSRGVSAIQCGRTASMILAFKDASNPGLRKMFAVGIVESHPAYEPMKKLLSGPLGKRLRLTDVSLIHTLRLEWIKALAAARNAGSLRKVIQRACAQLGIPEMRNLADYKSAMLSHQQYGFVWADAVGCMSFHHWMMEYTNLVTMGFSIPFALKDMINAWKEFRYYDFFRMGGIIDLTTQQTVGAQAFSEADEPAVHARILEQCRQLLPEHSHYIIKARHLPSLGKKMNFCVGYYAKQVESRSYVVVVSKKRGEGAVTTGFVLSGGLMRYQQAHIKNNGANNDCDKMMEFKPFSVATNSQALTVSYPQPEYVQQLQTDVLRKILRVCFYKDKRGKIRVYPNRKWAERHLRSLLEKFQDHGAILAPRLNIRRQLRSLPL